MTQNIKLDKIQKGEYQPRSTFDIKELARSISSTGLINPIILRKISNGYEIIAGERRYRAHVELNKNVIPSIVINVDDLTAASMALVENMQRAKLCPLDEAEHLYIMKEFVTSNLAQIGRNIGKSRAWVSNRLRLLQLTESSKEAIKNKIISATQGRTLLQFNFREQAEIINEIKIKKLKIDDVTKLLNQKLKTSVNKTKPVNDIHITDLENTLSNHLNAKTTVTSKDITINFHCKNELLGIIGKINR